jgi:hypothetical protein
MKILFNHNNNNQKNIIIIKNYNNKLKINGNISISGIGYI